MTVAAATQQQEGLRRYVGKEELQALFRTRPWHIAADTVWVWATILGVLWLWGNTRHPAAFVLAFLVVSARQHALNNFVHEASHYRISVNKARNDWLSDLFYAAPHLIITAGYRAKHLPHHTNLGHPVKDVEIKSRYVIRGTRFWRVSLRVLLGGAALDTGKAYAKTGDAAPVNRLRHLGLVALTNGLLLGFCWWAGDPLAWLYLWVLPLFTLTSYLATLRVLAEHQPLAYALAGEETFTEPLTPLTRSIPAGLVERFFLAPVNFCYHNEHHHLPVVPYTSLPGLHRLLRERGYFDDHPEAFAPSYRRALHALIHPETAGAAP